MRKCAFDPTYSQKLIAGCPSHLETQVESLNSDENITTNEPTGSHGRVYFCTVQWYMAHDMGPMSDPEEIMEIGVLEYQQCCPAKRCPDFGL
jgi:hypothetical protein